MTATTTKEHGYESVLVREESKKSLKMLRTTKFGNLPLKERIFSTAALELVIENPQLHDEWIKRIGDVVKWDITRKNLSSTGTGPSKKD